MRGLKQLLVKEKNRLEEIIKISKNRLKDVPEGSLRLSKTKNYVQYYHCTNENKLGKYIPKDKEELVRRLIQKSYDEKVLRLAEKRLKQVNKLAKGYEEDEIEEIYWEHNGMADSPEYAIKMVRKIEALEIIAILKDFCYIYIDASKANTYNLGE